MKLKLNESIKGYDAFLTEREAQAEATPVATVGAESRDAMIADVDSIINSLETLAGAVAEMKEDWTKEFALFANLNEGTVNENFLAKFVKARMLASKQKKITTMKLKASDMSTAAAQLQGADNRDKKAYILDKKKQLDDNVKELQAMVNDKAKEIGEVAVRIVNRVKLAGQIEVIKSQIGNVDPKQAKEMKQRLADISAKAKEEDEAIADFKAKADAEAQDEKGDDKIQDLKDQVSALKDEKKEVDTSTLVGKLKAVKFDIQIALLNAQIKAEDGDPNTDPSDDDKKAEDLKAKAAELEAKIKEEEDGSSGSAGTSGEGGESTSGTSGEGGESTSGTSGEGGESTSGTSGEGGESTSGTSGEGGESTSGTSGEGGESTSGTSGEGGESTSGTSGEGGESTSGTAGAEEEAKKKAEEEAKKKAEEEAKKKAEEEAKRKAAEEDPKEALVIRANAVGLNELASEIDSKVAWQLAEGTSLRLKYESLIRKAESDKTLNESRYFNNDVKDAFRRLL